MLISHGCTFTQSYESTLDLYSEGFSVGRAMIPANGTFSQIKNLSVQPYYIRQSSAIDTPISVALIVGGPNVIESLFSDVDNVRDPGNSLALLSDSRGGDDSFEPWVPGTNDSILSPLPVTENYGRPHRFAWVDIPSEQYDVASVFGRLIEPADGIPPATISLGVVAHGSTLQLQGPFPLKNTDKFLYIIPFLAGLKKTNLSSSFRVSFEVV